MVQMVFIYERYANMLLVLKKNVEEVNRIFKKIKINKFENNGKIIIQIKNDDFAIVEKDILKSNLLEKIIREQEYLKPSRIYKNENTIIDIKGTQIGGKKIIVIAGPCAVESKQQLLQTAEGVIKSGANILRAGAFKPRTSPYDFQGLGYKGIELIKEVKEKLKIPVTTEIVSVKDIELYEREIDVIQVGARNMQNFELLKELGKTGKPILLKRGIASTIDELLMAAEYIMTNGNENIILCERGIRTYERDTRFTLDISAIPIIKKKSHLPIIVDPSHAAGQRELIIPLSKAAIAAGADGIIVETHIKPNKALCDGKQSIDLNTLKKLMQEIENIARAVGRSL